MNANNLLVHGWIEIGTRFREQEFHDPYHNPGRLHISALDICGRVLWTQLHPDTLNSNDRTDRRILRIFQLGRILESEVIHLLRLGGARITFEQFEMEAFDGKLVGRCDAVADDKYLIEIKTMNLTSFSRLLADGVRDGFPYYYVQMQMYMHFLGLGEGFLVTYGKNDSQIAVMHVDIDPSCTQFHLQKAQNVINALSIQDIEERFIRRDACTTCYLYNTCKNIDADFESLTQQNRVLSW